MRPKQGANKGNFSAFQHHFADRGVRVLQLEQNYRSSANIVQAANAVIAGAASTSPLSSTQHPSSARTPKVLWTTQSAGSKVVVCECRTHACEIAHVADEMKRRHEVVPCMSSKFRCCASSCCNCHAPKPKAAPPTRSIPLFPRPNIGGMRLERNGAPLQNQLHGCSFSRGPPPRKHPFSSAGESILVNSFLIP